MNILISSGYLSYEHDANTKIVCTIAQKLNGLGHKVAVVGECLNLPDKSAVQENDGVEYHRLFLSPLVQIASFKLESYVRRANFNNDRNRAKRMFMLTHPMQSAVLAYRYSRFFTDEKRMKKYADKVLALSKAHKADCVICVYSPFAYTKPVFDIAEKFACPLYVWQLDPWGLLCLNEIALNITGDERVAQERNVFKLAKHIFTTSILKKQYSENSFYTEFNNKYSVLEFPNITQSNFELKAKPACEFDFNCINLVFCGIVVDIYRSPKYLLESLAQLIEQGVRFKAAFVGGKNSKVLDEYLKAYPEYFQYFTPVSVQAAFATMKAADILINIGNTFNNQVPSKIFDYFALGKPVLNVQKIDNCPAREYIERYPLAYTICETDKTLNVNGLIDFIEGAKTTGLEFSEVLTVFPDCTPEYVAAKISNTITAQ